MRLWVSMQAMCLRKNYYILGFSLLLIPFRPDAYPAETGALSNIRMDATVAAVEKVMPSVVNIASETQVESRDPYEIFLREFFGYGRRQPRKEYSRGSGVVIDERGYVLTNDHVVRGADRIWVKFNEEGEAIEAEIVELKHQTDLALLRLKSDPGRAFVAAEFAAPDDLYLGETVLAVGNPFGLGGSVSRGILSSKTRRPTPIGENMEVPDWLQTDAAINPGNSGGPLINLEGKVIGINVAVFQGGQGIGFAIPVKLVEAVLSEIFTPQMEGLWFGARFDRNQSPLVVHWVEDQSPAQDAGLALGDVLLAVNGQKVEDILTFNRRLLASGLGTPARLRVRRGEKEMDLVVTLKKEEEFFNASLVKRKLGVDVQEMVPALSRRLGLAPYQGLLIVGVDEGGAAHQANIPVDSVLLNLDGDPVVRISDAARILHQCGPGQPLQLDLVVLRSRGGYMRQFPAKAEVILN